MPGKNKFTLENIGDFLSKLAEKSDSSVYWLSSADFKKIQYVSPAYEKIWGRSHETLYQHPEVWITYLHPDDALHHRKTGPIEQMAERVAQLGHRARFEENYRIIRPDGEIRWIIDRGFPIFDNKGICRGVTGVAVDITKEKKAEEELRKAKLLAEAANIAKTQFIQNMQHDIITPASGIWAVLTDLVEEEESLHKKEKLILLRNSAKQLLNICKDVIDFDRIERGETPFINTTLDIKILAANVIALNQPAALKKKLQLSLTADNNIPDFIQADEHRISRILINLIGNAIKFTNQGNITLSIKRVKENDRGKHIMLQFIIKDTGIGIPEDKKSTLYEKFNRLIPSNQGKYTGSGLGLRIVKQFVDELGGSIEVDSEINKGTTFYVSIPFTISTKEQKKNTSKHDKARLSISPKQQTDKTSCVAHPLVLVIEDDSLSCLALKTFLSAISCEVKITHTIQSAKEVLDRVQFNIVLSDIGLPDGSGMELIRHVKSDKQSLNYSTPFIAITAHADKEHIHEAAIAGFNEMITKPLQKDHLKMMIDRYAGK